MRLKRYLSSCVATAFVLAALPSLSHAFDSTSLEFGTGNKTQIVRLGLQSDWSKRWFESNGTHLGGYWDLTLAGWRGTNYRSTGEHQNLADLGITPVFRFQNNSKTGFYGEAGIGLHLLSQVYDNNNRHFSTAFQFGDHIGVGYVFNNKFDLGLKLQHYSNAGIKHPNSGANFAFVRGAYRF